MEVFQQLRSPPAQRGRDTSAHRLRPNVPLGQDVDAACELPRQGGFLLAHLALAEQSVRSVPHLIERAPLRIENRLGASEEQQPGLLGLELDAVRGELVELGHGWPGEPGQRADSPDVVRAIAVLPEREQPTRHSGHGSRPDVDRAVRAEHPAQRLKHQSRSRERHRDRRTDPAGVPRRAPSADPIALEQHDVGAALLKLVGAQQPDDTPTDDGDSHRARLSVAPAP